MKYNNLFCGSYNCRTVLFLDPSYRPSTSFLSGKEQVSLFSIPFPYLIDAHDSCGLTDGSGSCGTGNLSRTSVFGRSSLLIGEGYVLSEGQTVPEPVFLGATVVG